MPVTIDTSSAVKLKVRATKAGVVTLTVEQGDGSVQVRGTEAELRAFFGQFATAMLEGLYGSEGQD
jgi:hypothetical protein